MAEQTLPILIGANTRFIISTSGRLSSLDRYRKLLQDILKLDIAYIPINNGSKEETAISPRRFAAALKGMPCIGGAISRDIKHSIIPFLDEVDEIAGSIQSVNTVIVQKDGKLKGYNTDALGFKYAIVNGMKKSGISVSSAVCYGYGGVASVVTTILKELGIKVYLIGRNIATATTRAAELDVEVWDESKVGNVELFVNATPATESPLVEAPNMLPALQGCKIAFDHEMPGQFLQSYCEASGIYHIKGLDMYYPQMQEQWKLFLEGIVDAVEVPQLLLQADAK